MKEKLLKKKVIIPAAIVLVLIIIIASMGGGGEYIPNEATSVFQRGSISVLCPVDSPALGGAVYVRIEAVAGRSVGDFEAAYVEDENVLIPNAQWGGVKDANSVAELVLLTRSHA